MQPLPPLLAAHGQRRQATRNRGGQVGGTLNGQLAGHGEQLGQQTQGQRGSKLPGIDEGGDDGEDDLLLLEHDEVLQAAQSQGGQPVQGL